MPSSTPYFGLAYFDFGDRLDSSVSSRLEQDRFTTIDKQFYGLYNVFGNGIISGWEIYDNGYSSSHGISIGISPGIGVIKYLAVETAIPEIKTALIPNSALFVYAAAASSATTNREVQFIVSLTEISGNVLKIANIVTGESEILSIDNTVRDYISIAQSIEEEIQQHKHRGSPSKIDLETETKNQLPGARIEGFDASKIVSGALPIERIPSLDHNNLINKGALTHTQIDALLNKISDQNAGLMGDVTSVNLLRQILFLKMRYTNVDQYMVNELAIIPGITSNSYIDFDETTALVDPVCSCLVGLPLESRFTYFFTNNFTLPSIPKKVILTSNKSIPDQSMVTFGINTTDSVDFANYTEITENKISDVDRGGYNIRVGIKFTWDGVNPVGFYEQSSDYTDYVNFDFTNSTGSTGRFLPRIRFYREENLSDTYLIDTYDSRIDQERWLYTLSGVDSSVPCAGIELLDEQSCEVSLYPDLSKLLHYKKYYIIVDMWNGTSFIDASSFYSFVVSFGSNIDPCSLYDYLPLVKNFALMFELEGGEHVTLNM